VDWKRLLANISGTVDQELLLGNEYLVTENRIIRNQLKCLLPLTDGERMTLAQIEKRLGKMALEEVPNIPADPRGGNDQEIRVPREASGTWEMS